MDKHRGLSLQGKEVLLGVAGGIAAYKAVDLVSRLVKLGASVNVIMTRNATQLVRPLTFRSISRNPVVIDMFAETADWQPKHVALADKADILVIAPATANIIAKLAHGIADDMLSTTALAARCPILVAPAMNCHMFDNPIFQENMRTLRRHNFAFVGPEYGQLACGYEGKGRLADVEKIIQKIQYVLQIPTEVGPPRESGAGRILTLPEQDFKGKTVLITAGPTREALDPIRFITNRSSGKMGYAIAETASDRGADVILISGPTSLPAPADVKLVSVETAIQMRDEVLEYASQAEAVIMAAAVSDYRPRDIKPQKIKKEQGEVTLVLERNPDILAELGQHKLDGQVLVGFSMETENVLDSARKKLKKKNADLMVANDVSQEGAGFGTDTNIVWLIDSSGGERKLPLMSKRDIADVILDEVKRLMLGEWNQRDTETRRN
jgi:phosphopantothenoylcysteine decarboxylase/phosphopantothenate--cysteine ligase